MGLIREPKNVDFYVIDKTWTKQERKEFSEFIKQRKALLKKSRQRGKSLKLSSKKQAVD